MIYGYARVSSKTQLKGNSLEEQSIILRENGCVEIVYEQYSAKTTERPRFMALIERLKEGDTLMVTKLDRFARNVTEGITLIRSFFAKGVKVHVLNIGLLENTSMGNFFVTTLLAVAELERSMILERTVAGKEIARTKEGFREGRRPISAIKIKHAMNLLQHNSYKRVAEITGISKATLVRAKRKYKDAKQDIGIE